ncbi:hypothetical protein [Kitasatospora sp. NPDC050543]|uniref:hypothetical protein n=1 Tax=Kitasatospora sp. NPDC050543 TaxID=3364054 RepID=UPI0037BA00CE
MRGERAERMARLARLAARPGVVNPQVQAARLALVRAFVRACWLVMLLVYVTHARVRLSRTTAGFRISAATPADPAVQLTVLAVLEAADRFGHSTRTGVWCEVDGRTG